MQKLNNCGFNALPKTKAPTLRDKIKAWFNPELIGLPSTKKETLGSESSESLFEHELEELDQQEKENEENDLREIEEEWIE
jgi:hypothetical protein